MKRILNNKGMWCLFIFTLAFNFSNELFAQDAKTTVDNRVYMKIEIKGMACPYCAYGMEKELKKVVGVNDVDIVLKKGLAYISTPKSQEPTEESLKKIIIESGFTVGKIEFSPKKFTIPKDDDDN